MYKSFKRRFFNLLQLLNLSLRKFNLMNENIQIKVFKWVSVLEAMSFLLLLFIAMPLKYWFNLPQMVEVVGMAHGILFISYIVGAIIAYNLLNWKFKTLLLVVACSVIPFGPFYIEKKYL